MATNVIVHNGVDHELTGEGHTLSEVESPIQENIELGAEETNSQAEAQTETAAHGPHISIKGEEVFRIGGFTVTNSILTTALVLVLFYFLAQYYSSESKKKEKGLGFYAFNGVIKAIYDLLRSVLNDKIFIFFPLLGAFFFFILLNNWAGLIPGVGSLLLKNDNVSVPLFRGGTADLNTTLTLAAITVFITQYFGFQYLGTIKHLGKYFNFKDPVMFFVGFLELILEFARIISFAFRLYGNIFAGEVLLTVVAFLLPVYLSFVGTPMFFMEIFVGVVQALVFTMLSTVFINMAIADHH